MLKDMKLKTKVLIGGLIPVFIMALVSFYSISNYKGVQQDYKWVEHTREIVELGQFIVQDAINMETGERGFLISGENSFLEPFEKGNNDIYSRFDKIKTSISDPLAMKSIEQAKQVFGNWVDVAQELISKRKIASDHESIKVIFKEVTEKKAKKNFDQFRTHMDDFFQREELLLQKRIQTVDRSFERTNIVIAIGTFSALLIAIVLMFVIAKSITTPILMIRDAAIKVSNGETDISLNIDEVNELGEMANAFDKMTKNLNESAQIAESLSLGNIDIEVVTRSQNDVLGIALKRLVENLNTISELAHRIGQGDLDVSVKVRSEGDMLGNALESLVNQLNTIMSEIKESTAVLGSASNEITATSAQVSSSVVQTSSAITQTSASVEQIKQTARLSSSKATHTAQSNERSLENAKAGTIALDENMEGLTQIKEKMDLIGSNIVLLSEQSQMIGDIISTVEDIANQSNLLAVNASIEAVKAGEHGAGFSVVAQELKNLAQQSKDGTKEIQKILTEVQKMTGTLVMVAEQGGTAVTNGFTQAQNAQKAISALNQSVSDAAKAAKQIAASYEQELIGMEQISDAVGNIKDAMNQNSDSIRQVEDSARNLNSLSQKLSVLLEQYNVKPNFK